MVWYGPGDWQFPPPPGGAQDLGWPQNHTENHQFSSQSPGQQKPWKLVPRPPKIMENWPGNHEKSNFCKSWFLQYLPSQMLGFPTPATQIQTHKSSEKHPGNRYEKILFFGPNVSKNLFKWVPLNRQKINKIQAWTSQCPFLCSPMSQDRPRVPQDAKVEAPSMPNDTHGH